MKKILFPNQKPNCLFSKPNSHINICSRGLMKHNPLFELLMIPLLRIKQTDVNEREILNSSLVCDEVDNYFHYTAIPDNQDRIKVSP